MSIVSSSGMFVNKETTSNDTMKQLRAFLRSNRLTKSKLILKTEPADVFPNGFNHNCQPTSKLMLWSIHHR